MDLFSSRSWLEPGNVILFRVLLWIKGKVRYPTKDGTIQLTFHSVITYIAIEDILQSYDLFICFFAPISVYVLAVIKFH